MPDMKDRVNRALGAVSGYHLAKGRPGVENARAVADLLKVEAELREQLDAARERIAQLQRHRKVERAGDLVLPGDLDPASREIIIGVHAHAEADYESLYALISAIRYVEAREIGGAVVDCGAGHGGSVQAAARTLVDLGVTSRELYTVNSADPESTAGELQVTVSSAGYPEARVHYLSGDAPDTMWAQVPSEISVLRIDVTDYRVADQELHQLWDRIVPGGVLIIDGFDRSPDAQDALDNLVRRTAENIFFVRAGSARVAAKTLG